ncbi:MAG: potassium channel family protein [Cellulosilyticaceae bacterium]
MKIVIAGIGKIGYHLTKLLIEAGHSVGVVEKNKALCEKMASEVEALIIFGDATNPQDLEDAGAADADVLVATTGKDEENLLICQMVQMNFSIPKTIARINNPKNEKVFKQLGIQYTVSSTNIIASIIEEEVIVRGLRTLLTIDKKGISLVEYVIGPKSKASGQRIKALALPAESNIAYILRGSEGIVPGGDVILQRGDHVIVVIAHQNKGILDRILG